ncbi:uncharacterized protein LOC141667685 isoform X2 [Apium graveolens]|uniref:uncharacterized protein LOC141667685 isoform X2 n=1 Tax=Apium graveolens TaxID=4045 RepID=UPI003D7B9041
MDDTEPMDCNTSQEDSNVKQHFSEGEFQSQLRETICKGSLDFDTWTALIAQIEKHYLDDINTISLVYDSFLSKFPLCHVYWKNYADHKARLCTLDKAVEIYERALQSATYCVSLWVNYCTFSITAFEDPCDIRRLFKRGMSFVGKDYLCHTLWDKYIEFECSQNQWSSLLRILIQSLRFPTKKLHNYYDNFKKFAAILEEERECLNISSMEVQAEVLPCGAMNMSETNIDDIIRNMQNPSNDSQCSDALQNYLAIGEQFYQRACQLEGKIHDFETSIGRPFFHMKPLDDNHLASWHSYLDFIEKQEDFDWIVKIYEKCLIPCANYPEFWMRYVEFMETKGGRELSNFALERATQIFLENTPVIHIFNARFREQIGDVHGARAAFLHGDKDLNSYFVESVIKAANMEKRLGNLAGASSIYENALNLASNKQKLHTVPVLYIHYSRLKHLIASSADKAIDVMLNGIEHVPRCRLLLEELLKLLMMHEGSKYMTVVDSIIANVMTSRPDVSQGLSTKDKEELSCLYLEYIDLCGTNDDVRKAWKRHIKLFPHLIRTTASNNNPNATHQLLDMAMEARKIKTLNQLPNAHGSGHLIQIPVEEEKELSTPENNGFLRDLVVTEKCQNEDGNSAQKEQLCLRNEVLSREDVAGDESKQKFLHRSENDVIRAMESTQAMVCNPRTDESELIEFTDGSAKQSEQAASRSEELVRKVEQYTVLTVSSEFLQQSSSSSDIHEMEENEHEKHLNPVNMEKVSLSSRGKESRDITTMELQERGVTQKSSFSDGQILDLGPSEEIQVTNNSKSSPPTNPASIKNNFQNDDSVNLSSSKSYQSPTQTQTECEVPANSGKNCPQNSISKALGGTSPELHDHSHGLQHPDDLQDQCSTDITTHVSVVNVDQGGNQYQSSAGQGNVTDHASPVKYVENQSYVSAPLSEKSPQHIISHPQALISHCSTRTSEPHGIIQNSQEHNQMLHLQQQQQQQQQQMLLHQQYQNQMLQLQNQYFQLQQQNQQLYQPPQQIQHHQYIQQTQQLQHPSYQLEQQQYLFYQQQQMLQQLHPGLQEQGTHLLGQHQTQLQQHNYQTEENARQQNEQGYQLQLQQYQVQQVYQQYLQQQNLQQQQAYQQIMLQNQAQQQQPIASTSTGNHPQGQALIPLRDKDAARVSENQTCTSPEGIGEPQNTVKYRPHYSQHPQRRKQSSHRASQMANTSLSPNPSDQSPLSQSKN